MAINHPAPARRCDLDALRAGAMLLGIVLHASLSFFPSYWMVVDSRQSDVFRGLFSAIHGFRMPLFFIMSGYFSAMLLHRRGRKELIRHRFHRVFLPLVAGMFTIIPLTVGISSLAMTSAPRKPATTAPAMATSNLWSAAREGDLAGIDRHLAGGVAVDAMDSHRGGTALMWAAVTGRADAVELLINRGADVNFAGSDGGTALHGAAFLGHEKAVDALIRGGANVNVVNKTGSSPLDTALLDEETTRSIASALQLELDEDGLGRRKAAIAESLRHQGASAGKGPGLANRLMQMPLFNHLWFLWFLWWLVLGYAAVSAIGSRLPSLRPPTWMIHSPARSLWLVPLTMIPQWFMGNGGASPIFGPDTSIGLLPIPHVLAYYAVFFAFGALYFGSDDRSGRFGDRWWLPLSTGLLLLLPLGLALIDGWAGPAGWEIPPPARRVFSVIVASAYPWCIAFGLIGLFRRICPFESPVVQYLSDSSYWLYLAHLPLIIAAQLLVRDWPIPALAKFLLIVVTVTIFLLGTYQVMVRYTALGRFLNGPRTRPQRAAQPAVVP